MDYIENRLVVEHSKTCQNSSCQKDITSNVNHTHVKEYKFGQIKCLCNVCAVEYLKINGIYSEGRSIFMTRNGNQFLRDIPANVDEYYDK